MYPKSVSNSVCRHDYCFRKHSAMLPSKRLAYRNQKEQLVILGVFLRLRAHDYDFESASRPLWIEIYGLEHGRLKSEISYGLLFDPIMSNRSENNVHVRWHVWQQDSIICYRSQIESPIHNKGLLRRLSGVRETCSASVPKQ